MNRAVTIIGRFAVGGWVIFTGTPIAVGMAAGLVQGAFNLDPFWVVFLGLAGAVGGAVFALVVLGLQRLIKRPAASTAAEDEPAPGPAVWPPAPKPPQ